MKKYLLIIISLLILVPLFSQIHDVPEWFEHIPQSRYGEVYSVGISDPRMNNPELAEEIAIHRALTLAVLMDEMTIFYVSDYFETRTEEHRWYIVTQKNQEMSKINAASYIDSTRYEIIHSEKNTNDEHLVLIKYFPLPSKDTNFYVTGKFFRQDFEVSNTRAMESIKTFNLETEWHSETKKEPIKTKFRLTDVNNSVSTQIFFNNTEIKPPGYSYRYFETKNLEFNIANYQYGSNLNNGLWIAYLESFVQSVNRLSRNYSSRLGTVFDDYDVTTDDDLMDKNQKSLNRQACINVLGFDLKLLHIHNHMLFPRLNLKNQRTFYNKAKMLKDLSTEKGTDETQKSCWFLNLFKRKNK